MALWSTSSPACAPPLSRHACACWRWPRAAPFCVMEFTEILGQSQPRLSRHLKLLCDCGLLDRVREGANVWFALPPGDQGALARDLVARLPADDPILEADRRQAARVLAERARVASESFRHKGADWDEMRALDLPAQAVEDALLALVPAAPPAGCWISAPAPAGCWNCSPRASARGWASMRRRRCWRWRGRGWPRPGLAHCAVRLADMYRLPLRGRVLRHRGAADGAALCRRPGRRRDRGRPRARPRAGACCVIDLAEHAARRPDRQAGASLARLRRRQHRTDVRRRRAATGGAGGHCRHACRCASGPPSAWPRRQPSPTRELAL